MKSDQMGYKLQEVKEVAGVATNCSGHRITRFCLHPPNDRETKYSHIPLVKQNPISRREGRSLDISHNFIHNLKLTRWMF